MKRFLESGEGLSVDGVEQPEQPPAQVDKERSDELRDDNQKPKKGSKDVP